MSRQRGGYCDTRPFGVPGCLLGRAALCARGRRPAPLMVLLVAPRVFRAPEGPAAREARRPHFVRRRASKPARALRSLRRPPHQWGVVADVARCIVSKPGQAPPPPTGTAAWPCGPSGALHTSGAGSLIGASSRSPARPRRFLWASWGVLRVEFLGCSGACCYKRRQSKVFFVWLSAPLLRTSSIRGLFR